MAHTKVVTIYSREECLVKRGSRPGHSGPRSGKRWTVAEDAQLDALFNSGKYTWTQIANLLGRSKMSVKTRFADNAILKLSTVAGVGGTIPTPPPATTVVATTVTVGAEMTALTNRLKSISLTSADAIDVKAHRDALVSEILRFYYNRVLSRANKIGLRSYFFLPLFSL